MTHLHELSPHSTVYKSELLEEKTFDDFRSIHSGSKEVLEILSPITMIVYMDVGLVIVTTSDQQPNINPIFDWANQNPIAIVIAKKTFTFNDTMRFIDCNSTQTYSLLSDCLEIHAMTQNNRLDKSCCEILASENKLYNRQETFCFLQRSSRGLSLWLWLITVLIALFIRLKHS